MTCGLIKRGNLDTEICTQGEHHVNIKAEVRAICVQDKERQRLPANYQKPGRGLRQVLPHSWQEEPTLLTPLISVWSGHSRWLFSCSLYIPCLTSACFTYILSSGLTFLCTCPRPQLVIVLIKGAVRRSPSAGFPGN